MRHYYDSRFFPFLSDILFDQLLNFDWATTRRELEEERKDKNENLPKKTNKEHCNYLRVLDDEPNKDIKLYSPTFELIDGEYVYKTILPKEIKPEDIHIDVSDRSFYLSYTYKTENGETSAAILETLPVDLDTDTLKAVLKNGNLTVKAQKVVEVEEPEVEEGDDEVEYEIEIGK